jgi:hypothetical protein
MKPWHSSFFIKGITITAGERMETRHVRPCQIRTGNILVFYAAMRQKPLNIKRFSHISGA